jgi:cell division protein FtsL
MARALRAPETRSTSDSRSRSESRQRAASGARTTQRQHSGATRQARTSARTITTRTAKDRAHQSPIARVVNKRDAPARLRRFVFIAVGIAVAAITLMMLVVVFQTRLAETQLGIDDIELQITAERNRYDQLRLERSILREPARLVAEAKALGMVPGSKTDFRTVDPLVVAEVLVSVGGSDPNAILGIKDSLERYGSVKAIIGDRR